MNVSKTMVIVAAAGGVFASAANAQKVNRVERQQNKTQVTTSGRTLQSQPFGVRVTPVSYAKATRRNGQIFVGEFRPYVGGAGGTDGTPTNVFDCYEGDALGAPTGFNEGGCVSNPVGPPGNRWFYGPTYLNPDSVNDFTAASGSGGAQIDRLDIAWNWGIDPAGVPRNMVVAIFVGDTFNDCASGQLPVLDGEGIILNFQPSAGGVGGYFYSNIEDIQLDPQFANFVIPADGGGYYEMILATEILGGTITLDTFLGTQPMLWGTGDGEVPNDGRPGTQGPNQWDDDGGASAPAPTPNGMFALDECYDYAAATCPSPIGVMTAMWALGGGGGGCYANCDGSTSIPFLNINDFVCFQQAFAAGQSYANCDNSTSPPTLNINDFVCFQQAFAAGCSAP
jgi:hypothetical protein